MDKAKGIKRTFQEVLETDTPEAVSFVIDWTIPNFTKYRQHPSSMLSRPRAFGKSFWRLGVYPHFRTEGSSMSTIGLFLQHTQPETGDSTDFHIQTTAKLMIVGSAGELEEAETPSTTRPSITRPPPKGNTVYSHVFSRNSVTGSVFVVSHFKVWPYSQTPPPPQLLVDGKLHVRAEVTFYSLDPVEMPADRVQLLEIQSSLQDDYQRLYETKTAHDFILVSSDGIEKSVHRVVLIARSPVFAAMFDAKLSEHSTGRCVIQDIPSSILDVLIKYMYCGCLADDMKENTDQILLAADKYQLTPLVNQCEQWLIQNIDKANVVNVLLLTDGVTAPALKDAALRHIRANPSSLENGGGLSKLMEKGSADLIGELVKFALRH